MKQALLTTLAASAIALGAVTVPSAALAQDCDNPRKASGSLSEFTYRRMTQIQELIGESEYRDAIKKLDSLVGKVRKNDYEYALVMQTYGFAYSAQEQYSKAADAFQQALSKNALQQDVHENMLYNVGQLYMAGSDYDNGIRFLKRYIDETCAPVQESAYILLANAYVEKQQFRTALPWVEKAINAKRGNAPETWYQLKLAIHYELRQFKSAAQVLVSLISKYPVKEQYWKQLSGVFLEMKDDQESLAVLALAERQGFLDTEREIENFANVYLFLDIPFKAAKIMTDGMKRGILPRNGENLKKLGTAWQLARENDQAFDVLTQAANATGDGDIWVQLGQIKVDEEAWDEAIPLLQKAVNSGAKRVGDAYLMLGVAYFQQEKKNDARKAFRSAQRYSATKRQASNWLAHISQQG